MRGLPLIRLGQVPHECKVRVRYKFVPDVSCPPTTSAAELVRFAFFPFKLRRTADSEGVPLKNGDGTLVELAYVMPALQGDFLGV